MKVNNILYLNDDMIYLKIRKQNKTIKYKINKKIISNGKIYSIDKFLKVYSKILSDYNLNNNLFGDTIKVIINETYTPADISLIKLVLEKFNYRKILFINETKIYKLNNTNAYINITNTYLTITFIDEYKQIKSYLLPFNYFNSNEEILLFIKKKVANREIHLIGKGEMLEEIFQNFENLYQNKTYMYTNSELYLFNNLL